MRRLIYKVLYVFIVIVIVGTKAPVWAKTMTIVIDPGHGGSQSGAFYYGTDEKDINLTIAGYLKEELEKYEDVNIVMTRTGDQTKELVERFDLAIEEDADLMISIHNNAVGDICEYTDGCTVLVATGNANEKIAVEEQELGVCILQELSVLGLKDRGLLLRTSESGGIYDNGKTMDYYGLVNRGILYDIPTIIVEHAFLDDLENYQNHLSGKEQLRELAVADAVGIARYYGLKNADTGMIPHRRMNIEEKFVLVSTGHYQDNQVWTKTFFPNKPVADARKRIEKLTDSSWFFRYYRNLLRK